MQMIKLCKTFKFIFIMIKYSKLLIYRRNMLKYKIRYV